MNNSQNQNSAKVQKDDVQRKSHFIFMQLGLAIALLLAFLAIEAKTYDELATIADNSSFGSTIEEPIPPEIIPFEEPNRPLPKVVDLSIIEVIDDDNKNIESIIDPKIFDPNDGEIIKTPDDIPEEPIKEPIIETTLTAVHEAPIFPGCKGNTEELKKCFSEKVSSFVNSKIDPSVTETLDLEKKQKVYIQFIVDQEGNIVEIEAKSTYNVLAKESKRAVNLLPKMTPGKINSKAVRIKYILPITFQSENN